MLPDRHTLGRTHRHRLALVSHTLLELHGGTLTALSLARGGSDANVLARLVQLQHGLKGVRACNLEALPAVASVIAQGHLRLIQELSVNTSRRNAKGLAMVHVQLVTTAMQVPGVLEALEVVEFTTYGVPGMVPLMAGALATVLPHRFELLLCMIMRWRISRKRR